MHFRFLKLSVSIIVMEHNVNGPVVVNINKQSLISLAFNERNVHNLAILTLHGFNAENANLGIIRLC